MIVVFIATYGFSFYKIQGDLIDKGFLSFILAVVAFFISLPIVMGIGCFLPKMWKKQYSETLVSLKNSERLQGTFILGTGTLGSSVTYEYFRTVEGGGYKLSTIQGDVTIFEEERDDGMLIAYERVFVKDWAYIFAGPAFTTRYEFHVPHGTVVRKFELN